MTLLRLGGISRSLGTCRLCFLCRRCYLLHFVFSVHKFRLNAWETETVTSVRDLYFVCAHIVWYKWNLIQSSGRMSFQLSLVYSIFLSYCLFLVTERWHGNAQNTPNGKKKCQKPDLQNEVKRGVAAHWKRAVCLIGIRTRSLMQYKSSCFHLQMLIYFKR